MPFINIDAWNGISTDIKKKLIYESTHTFVELFNIAPDKIQVVIRETPKENWGKAGAVSTDIDFDRKSRSIDWITGESYDDGKSPITNMVVISIDVWNVLDWEKKEKLAEKLTELMVNLLKISPDNVLILLRDMPPGNWIQAGVSGANSEFFNLSRRSNI